VDTVSVDEAEAPADRLIEVGLRDGCGPDGETATTRFTDPEKPFKLLNVRVAVADEPCVAFREVALGVKVKSGVDDV
jgi:hypothetical protein